MSSDAPSAPQRHLKTIEAARFLGLSDRTLEKHRSYGTGPVYRKIGGRVVYALDDLIAWWRAAPDRASVVFCYAFGKAQRLLAELHGAGVEEEVLLHGAVQALMDPYRAAGVPMPPTRPLSELDRNTPLAGRLVLAPPAAQGSSWMNRLRDAQCGLASGWMAVRGSRRRRGSGRGFVLSDHADWPGLLRTVRESQARQVVLTHGQGDSLARYLREEEGIACTVLSRGEGRDDSRNEED